MKKDLMKKINDIISTPENFFRYVEINNKLASAAGIMIVIGVFANAYNLISTLIWFIENGFRYIRYYFIEVYFSTQGTNMFFAITSIIGIILIIIGVILLLVYNFFVKENYKDNLFSQYKKDESIQLTPVFRINKHYGFSTENEENYTELKQFMEEDSKASIKLVNFFKRVTNKTTIKDINNKINKLTSIQIEGKAIIALNTINLIKFDNQEYLITIVDSSSRIHAVNIKKMISDNLVILNQGS